MLHPKLKIFTRVNNTTGVKTRIDRLYLSKLMKTKIKEVKKITSTVSDHDGFLITLQGELSRQFTMGKGVWKMNVEILKNENFILEIEDLWNSQISQATNINWAWWDKVKVLFKEVAIRHGIRRSKNYYKELNNLEKGLNQIEALLTDPNINNVRESLLQEKEGIINKIRMLYNERQKGAIFRSRCQILVDNENPSSSFLKLETKKAKKAMLEGILDKEGKLTSNTNETVKVCEKFYSDLYKVESYDVGIAQEFLTDLPQINHIDKENCDKIINEDELKKTVDSLKNNIAPGQDGLPTEFYKKFWYLFGKTFTDIVKFNFENGQELSSSQKEGMIKLICKNRKQCLKIILIFFMFNPISYRKGGVIF